jgi:flavorubredoxin
MARIDQVGDKIYRISVFTPEKRVSFNQFLIDDERPALIHTGAYPMYQEVREAVSPVGPPDAWRELAQRCPAGIRARPANGADRF